MTIHTAKNVTILHLWAITVIYSLFRYQPWHILDRKYCSGNNLLALAKVALQPDNWLFVAAIILTIVIAARLYVWAENHWIWFGCYGRTVTVCMIFVAMSLISWGCK